MVRAVELVEPLLTVDQVDSIRDWGAVVPLRAKIEGSERRLSRRGPPGTVNVLDPLERVVLAGVLAADEATEAFAMETEARLDFINDLSAFMPLP